MVNTKDIMEKAMDPKFQELYTKYNNARVGVAEGYRLAKDVLKFDSVPTQEGVDQFCIVARMFAKKYENDLNNCLVILEEKDGVHKTEPSSILRPS